MLASHRQTAPATVTAFFIFRTCLTGTGFIDGLTFSGRLVTHFTRITSGYGTSGRLIAFSGRAQHARTILTEMVCGAIAVRCAWASCPFANIGNTRSLHAFEAICTRLAIRTTAFGSGAYTRIREANLVGLTVARAATRNGLACSADADGTRGTFDVH